jgi:5-methylcytosine-specific restriction endonuclease McrA
MTVLRLVDKRKGRSAKYLSRDRKIYQRGYGLGRYSGLQYAVFLLLGGKCANCGNTDKTVLQIDHTKNNGAVHRKSLGTKGGPAMLVDICKSFRHFSKDYQLLCANCHVKKTAREQMKARK